MHIIDTMCSDEPKIALANHLYQGRQTLGTSCHPVR